MGLLVPEMNACPIPFLTWIILFLFTQTVGSRVAIAAELCKTMPSNKTQEECAVWIKNELNSHPGFVNCQLSDGSYLLLRAIRTNDKDLVSKIIDAGANLEVCDLFGNDSLKIAVEINNLEILSLLLVKKKLIDSRNFDGKTALHDAVARGNYSACRILLDYHASPNIQDNQGFTPLSIACHNNCHENICRLLLDNGANPWIENVSGNNSIELLIHRSILESDIDFLNKEFGSSPRPIKDRSIVFSILYRKLEGTIVATGGFMIFVLLLLRFGIMRHYQNIRFPENLSVFKAKATQWRIKFNMFIDLCVRVFTFKIKMSKDGYHQAIMRLGTLALIFSYIIFRMDPIISELNSQARLEIVLSVIFIHTSLMIILSITRKLLPIIFIVASSIGISIILVTYILYQVLIISLYSGYVIVPVLCAGYIPFVVESLWSMRIIILRTTHLLRTRRKGCCTNTLSDGDRIEIPVPEYRWDECNVRGSDDISVGKKEEDPKDCGRGR